MNENEFYTLQADVQHRPQVEKDGIADDIFNFIIRKGFKLCVVWHTSRQKQAKDFIQNQFRNYIKITQKY